MLRRLDVRIPILLSLILAVMVALFGWRVSHRQGEAYLQSIRERARILAQAHANDAAHFMVIGEYSGLEDHMLESAQLTDIRRLQVFEPDGRMLCHVEREGSQGGASIRPAGNHGEVPRESREHLSLEAGRLVIWVPIEAGELIGWLRMDYALDPVREMQAAIWRNTAAMGGVLILTGTALVLLVLRKPLKAIHDLGQFSRGLNLRKGDQVRLPPVSSEIDDLAEALNGASEELLLAEQRLLAEQERLAVTIRSIGDGVVACDREGRVTLMNRVAEQLTGWPMAEARGRAFQDIFRLADERTGQEVLAPLLGVMEAGRARDLVGRSVLVAKDGSRHPVTDSGAPILDHQGETLGVVVVFRDESQRRQEEQRRLALEEQLRQSQKMEAVGQMAGGIAHDFNNLLTAIIGYTSLLLSRPEGDEKVRELAQRILKAADRAGGLTRSLLAFSRKQKLEMKPADLNEVLRGLEHLLRRLIGEDITLKAELAPIPLVAQVDAGQIAQVILNLATNARDAMPQGGLLSLTSQLVDRPSLAPGDGDTPLSGPCALVCVSDTGSGMDEATLAKVFEPFFTTKEPGKGTGLGLAIVHGIVRQHGAVVRVYSHPGIGTTFKLYFPLLSGGQAVPGMEADEPVRGGEETLLLAEDEAEVRKVVALMLEGGGYRVLQAADGPEALTLLESGAEQPALVISDVIMPGMTGRELAEKAHRRRPGLPVLFVSGYTADIIAHKGFLGGEVDLLMKPFDARALLRKVREILDRA